MAVYLKLFHGRNTKTEGMDDWGYDGPTIGPLEYVHTTYKHTIQWADKAGEHVVQLDGDLFPWDGKFYGDWSVHSKRKG